MTPQERLVILRVAVVDAIAAYWNNRAKSYEARGQHEVARACRNRAAFALMGGDDDEVEALLDDAEVTRLLRSADDNEPIKAPPSLTCSTCMTPTSPWSCSCGETRIGGAA